MDPSLTSRSVATSLPSVISLLASLGYPIALDASSGNSFLIFLLSLSLTNSSHSHLSLDIFAHCHLSRDILSVSSLVKTPLSMISLDIFAPCALFSVHLLSVISLSLSLSPSLSLSLSLEPLLSASSLLTSCARVLRCVQDGSFSSKFL